VCLGSCFGHPVCYAHAPYYIVCGASRSTWFFPINGTIFEGKKCIENNMCVFISSTKFVWKKNVIIRNLRRDIINLQRYSCKVPVTVVRFYSKLNFLDRFLKNTHKISWKSVRRKPSSMRTDETPGRTDMTKPAVTFSKCANAPCIIGNKKTF